MICTCLLATLSLVPYPVKAAEKTGMVPQDTAVRYETDAKIPAEGRVHVLGAQGCNWTEFTRTAKELEWKMWPRGCALAEVFWTGEARPGFTDFRLRMKNHRARLIASGVNCATY